MQQSKNVRLAFILVLVGSFLGPFNIAFYFYLGSMFNEIPFYSHFTKANLLMLWTGVWFYLLIVPCFLGTVLTLGLLWQDLKKSISVRDYVIWGIIFGAAATITSTLFFLLLGVVFNYSKGFSTFWESLAGTAVSFPGALVLGVFFILIFAPMIAVSGSLFGLLAKRLN